jgi:hypothetical protein
MIICGFLAGLGLYDDSLRIIQECVDSYYVEAVYVLTPKGRHGELPYTDKLHHINRWIGEDSHDKTGINREQIRKLIELDLAAGRYTSPIDLEWVWMGDEDAMPAPDFFEVLSTLHYDKPTLLTGKTFNADGQRWFDICGYNSHGMAYGHPDRVFLLPYDDWDNPARATYRYASGNQHIMNRAGFDLNVPYRDLKGEDPVYCQDFIAAGGQLAFEPRLSVRLMKQHPTAQQI